ncbi:MAG TPA: trimethylamine methyltransferase family protein [Steroidobacteraceae bacterium]|jgi:trimethylamine--corrinoid protein Co-methyltransferase|nr:trimethylamine methyltransferase family protein [Steroidobacteraceae bacterium]
MSVMESRRRREGGRSRRTAGHLPQLPWQPPTNPYMPMEVLSADQIEAIHVTSLRILEELGIELMSPRARAVMRAAGAEVDEATGTVRLDRGLVATKLAQAPPSIVLTPRNPAKRITLGGNHINFGLVAGPPNVHDCERGRRAGNYADYCDFVRLAHYFNAIHLIGNQVCAPVELPANSRHLDTYRANLSYSDLVFHCSAIGAGRALDGIRMMAIARGISLEEAARSPGVLTIISVNSPRRFDEAMAEGLMAMAQHGQPVVITPFTLMGAMAPVSLAAALAQQNAEALFGIVLAQQIRPGTPVVYGAFTSNVDMRSGAPAFGTPENAKANVASGQLVRRYRLPYRSSNASASNAADAQGAYETEMSLWGAILGHSNLIYHAAGWQEGGLTASFEKLVLDVEMLQMMMEFMKPIVVNEAELGFDAISHVATGGHFFGEPHTMERYEHAFYQPLVSNWQNFENWQLAGGKDATQRATEIWKRALTEYEEPPMDAAIREELDAYVTRRRAEIGSNDP